MPYSKKYYSMFLSSYLDKLSLIVIGYDINYCYKLQNIPISYRPYITPLDI